MKLYMKQPVIGNTIRIAENNDRLWFLVVSEEHHSDERFPNTINELPNYVSIDIKKINKNNAESWVFCTRGKFIHINEIYADKDTTGYFGLSKCNTVILKTIKFNNISSFNSMSYQNRNNFIVRNV